MVSTSRGQTAIYNGGIPQQGGSLLSKAKDASAFAKKHKLVSKGSALATDLGFDKSLNKATKELYWYFLFVIYKGAPLLALRLVPGLLINLAYLFPSFKKQPAII